MTQVPDEQYARVHEILGGARSLDGDGLKEYLDEACGEDSDLRSRVMEILEAARHDDPGAAFAEESLSRGRQSLERLLDGASASWLPEKIGEYTILSQLGQGGMGVVYEAEQVSPRRRVAIKLLHPMHANPERLRRFRREAELLGRLQHAGIAQIFEAGTYDVGRGPQPYFAMELVDGVDVWTYCEREGLDHAARIRLLARIADAVHYAHERGVIHRDLKPDNVLVDRQGNPRVLDFGIARASSQSATLSTIVTEDGQMVGTLAYMAPEQLRQSADAVTTKVDVYALGVLGFELLVGRLPHETEEMSISQAIAHLATSEAPRAGALDTRLRGDVETILVTALESDRDRRYATASAMAADLRRYLANQPINARAPSRVYLARKFVRRHKALVGGTVATLVVAVVGAVIAIGYATEANRRARELERSSYLTGIAAAGSAIEQQDYGTAKAYLDRVPKVHRGWEYDHLRARTQHHLDEWETPAPVVTPPVFSPDGSRMYAVVLGGSLATWDTADGTLMGTRRLEGLRLNASTPGAEILLHGPSTRYAAMTLNDSVVIGDLESGKIEHEIMFSALESESDELRSDAGAVLDFDAAGNQLLFRAGPLRAWDFRRDEGDRARIISGEQSAGVFDPPGARIISRGTFRTELRDAITGEVVSEGEIDDEIVHFAFSPDGSRVAVAGAYRNLYLLDADTLSVRQRLLGHQGAVSHVVWTPDGSRLLSTSLDETLRIWNGDGPGVPTTYLAGVGPHQIPRVGPPPYIRPLVAVDSNRDLAVVVGERIRRFPLEDPQVLRGHSTFVYYVAFSPDGSRLVSACWGDRDIRVWTPWTDEPPWVITTHTKPMSFGTPLVAFSSDGRRLVVSGNNQVTHWDVESREPLAVSSATDPEDRFFETLGRGLDGFRGVSAVSPDRSLLAICKGPEIQLYDRFSIEGLTDLGITFRTEFVPDDPERPIARLVGHIGEVFCVAFSPDGKRIATGGNDTTVRIWDAETMEELLVLHGHTQYVMHVAFSEDGSLLASASGDTTVRLWDSVPLPERRAASAHR